MVTYIIVCDEKSEKIDMRNDPNGRLVVFALLARWRGCSVRMAYGDDYDCSDYSDVTDLLIDEYSYVRGTKYRREDKGPYELVSADRPE